MLPTSWKDSWEQMHERRNYLSVFLYITLGSFGLFALLSLLSLGKLFPFIFFVRGTDSFMDFFNSIRDAAQGIEAYTERHIIYPPMANLFFWFLAKITPERYNNTTFEDRRNWLGEPVAIALLLVFLVLCAVLFAFLVWRNLKTDRRSKLLFTAASVCCLPFVTMMERGNILILCVLALLVYTATYDSDRWYAREIGLLALAFAFSIKLYPILFAWLLLSDKRIAAFLRCMLYSVAMLILPSFFFGGPQVFLSLLKNIFSFSEGGGGAANGVTDFLHLPPQIMPLLTYSIFLLAALNFLLAPFVYRQRWRVLMCGCMTFVAFPSLTSTYGWILFLLPLICFANDSAERGDFRYILTMTVPFAFIPIPISFHVTANAVAVYICLWILLGITTADTVRGLIRKIRKTPLKN